MGSAEITKEISQLQAGFSLFFGETTPALYSEDMPDRTLYGAGGPDVVAHI